MHTFPLVFALVASSAARLHPRRQSTSHVIERRDSSCSALYYQCGGENWTGATCCASGSTCVVMNPFYSQCVASTASTDSSTSTSTSPSSIFRAHSSSYSLADTSAVITTTKSAAFVRSSATAATASSLTPAVASSALAVVQTTASSVPSIATSLKTSIAKSSTKTSASATKVSATTSAASSVGTSAASTGLLSTCTGKQSGDGTFYGTSDSGAACSLPTRTDQRFAAFTGAAWDNSEWCGGCIRVTGPSGTVDVQVTIECPECAEGSLDLATDAFAQPTSAGRISITWNWIDCETAGLTTGDVTFAWKSGSTAYWAGIQPRGGRVAVTSVSIKEDSATSYTALTRENYNYWVATSGAGEGPFTVLVDWQDGTSTTTSGVVLNAGVGDS